MPDEKDVSYEWHCRTCNTTKKYGAAKLQSEIQAGRHVRRHSLHSVECRAVVVTHRFTGHDQETLTDFYLPGDEPPF